MLNIEEKIESKLKSFLGSDEALKAVKKIEEVSDQAYTIKFKITNESVDRDGEVILSKGINWEHFDKNPVFLINHSYKVESIAGKCISRETVGNENYMTVKLAKGVEAGELVKKLHEQGMIKGVSIGFIPLERDAKNGKLITRSEALEASAVPIGSNREALVEDEKTMKSCVNTGMVKAKNPTLVVGNNILYREKITRHGSTEFYPNKPQLPNMGKIVAIYSKGQLLNWDELIVPTKENPYLIIQAYVRSKKGPILLRTYTHGYELERLEIENSVKEKSIEDGDVEFENCEKKSALDSNELLNTMKTMSDGLEGLKSQIKTIVDDKTKVVNLEKSRIKGQELVKSLSGFLKEAKEAK